MKNKNHHFLLVSLPAQGHINPMLQLAKKLARAGARVTFTTTTEALPRMRNLPSVDGLFFSSFSAGKDNGEAAKTATVDNYIADFNQYGPVNLSRLLETYTDSGHPVTFIVYSIMIPWAACVARELHVPSAFLFIQNATVFSIYHHFFNSNNGIHYDNFNNDPSFHIKLPELPPLTCSEIPSFLLPNDPLNSVMTVVMRDHMKNLEIDHNPLVLINTFEALEEKILKTLSPNMNFIPIGPLIPSEDESYGCDLFGKSKDYLSWLDSKAEGSVIYVSFGSLAEMSDEQREEILEALKESKRPFLWVLRSGKGEEREDQSKEIIGAEKRGLIVSWCTQTEVLFHKSVGCFLTHCGWNSTLESLIAGVPIVACPQFSDQLTNAKLVEDVWGVGVRARANEKRVVERGEIKRCLEIVTGEERGVEIRNHANKWATLALQAIKNGGSSNHNLEKFMEDI